ncbi:hypothetical protein Q1695_007638 [Nippostrongylus brasiliensis]|nr:hypothetical protein Q1695_007638 [Nippostrongylus brasiliensis]
MAKSGCCDLARERLARDLSRQKFAFAFAKRGQEALEEKLRFARDLENAKKFAFAKRSADSSDEERARNRFARELDTPKKFAFAFAKRFAGMERDEQLARFARPSFA